MSKYWKLIIVTIIIISTISTYYISSYIEARSYPEFHIQTLEGNEQVIESLVIGMLYRDGEKEGYSQLTKEGHVYRDQQSFFDQYKGVPFSYERKLRDHYSKVLRSVNYYGSNIFENDQYIILANINDEGRVNGDQTLVVKWLAKDSGKLQSINYPLDNKIHPRIQDIQMNGNEIIVFTFRWEENAQGVIETIHTYHFDTDSGAFNREATILSGDADSAVITKLEETSQWQPNEYIVYRKKESGDESNVLMAYEVSSGEIKAIDLPDELRTKGVSWFDGSNLYYAEHAEVTRVTVYSIKEERILSHLMIENNPTVGQNPVNLEQGTQNNLVILNETSIISVNKGFLYSIDARTTGDQAPQLVVWDVKTGQPVYRGEIKREESTKTSDSNEVEIYNLFFR